MINTLRDFVPQDIARERQFVLWKYEKRLDGTIGKAPYNARAANAHKQLHASSTNHTSWSTLAQAEYAYTHRPGYNGIGYVLCNGIIAIDIDNCINTSTKHIDPRAERIITTLNTATERSPSGTGLHLWIRGTLPDTTPTIHHYKGLKIELYISRRYITLTGDRLTHATWEERTSILLNFLQQCQHEEISENTVCVCGGTAVNPSREKERLISVGPGDVLAEADLTLAERIILRKARAAKNAAIFNELWAGGDPRQRLKNDGTLDRSAGDFDLILMLLYWTNDNVELTGRLFRASRRYQLDKIGYLERSIQNALARRRLLSRS